MCPKISRRSAPGFHQKQSKRPQICRRYAPEPCKWCERKDQKFCGATRRETHHQISPHILNMCLQPCLPAWPDTRDVPPPTMPPTIPLTATAPGTLANNTNAVQNAHSADPSLLQQEFAGLYFGRVCFRVYFTCISHTYTATTPRCASWRVCRGSAIVKKTRNKYTEVLFR